LYTERTAPVYLPGLAARSPSRHFSYGSVYVGFERWKGVSQTSSEFWMVRPDAMSRS